MIQTALIVEDHPIVSDSITSLITTSIPGMECRQAASGREALALLNSTHPDIILLDINLPDMSGIDFLREARSRFAGLKVLAFTSIEQRHVVEQLMSLDVNGFILKSADTDEIVEAIRQVLHGNEYFGKQVSDLLQGKSSQLTGLPALTQREMEVLKLIAEGLTNQEIADQLFISAWTVDTHRKNLLMKFNARNTASLVKTAATSGLLD